MSESWLVYILHCNDGTLYTGITTDMSRRLNQHETGLGAKYTRGRGPFKVHYMEYCEDRSAASKRELAIKSMTRDDKMALESEVSFERS
jgi:putative endonuclease